MKFIVSNFQTKLLQPLFVINLFILTTIGLFAQTRPVVNHNISTGNLIIAPGTTNDYSKDYYVTGTTTVNRIIVGSGYNGKITLDNVSITVNNTGNVYSAGVAAPCGNGSNLVRTGSCMAIMGINGNGTNLNPVTSVQLVLKGMNTLRQWGDGGYCGIQVDQGATIFISAIDPDDNNSGKLFANSMNTTSTDPNVPPAKPGPSQGGAAIGAMHGMGGHVGLLYNGNQGEGIISGKQNDGSSCPFVNGAGQGTEEGKHFWTNGGNIVITSGTITAWGGHATGIGGGFRAYYDGMVIITGGNVKAYAGIHAAGLGGGCPYGGFSAFDQNIAAGDSANAAAIRDCYAENSAVIVLPPASINAYGALGNPYTSDASLGLAGANFIAYVNDPAKPLMTIRCEDWEPFAPIYIDFTKTRGLQNIFDIVYPSFELNKVKIGYTNAGGTIPLHGLFLDSVIFFTTASSTKPGTYGRPYLPNNTTVLNGGTIILPLLDANVIFTDQWATPLCLGYTATQALENAYRLKIEYNDTQPLENMTYQLQGATDFKKMIFLDENLNVMASPPLNWNQGLTFYIQIPIEANRPLGYYNDVLLIHGDWKGVPLSGYIRRIGRQRVVLPDNCNPSIAHTNFCVTANTKSFIHDYPVPAGTNIQLSLSIQHSNQNKLPYDPYDVMAWYTISKSPTFEGAVAEKPHYEWTPLNIPLTAPGTVTTTVFFNNLPPGVYYIHWWVESGTEWAYSRDVSTPNQQCGGYGAYVISSGINPGTISGPNAVCSGNQVLLTGTAVTGGTGNFTYNWQYSANLSGPWTNLPAPNNLQNYTVASLTTRTYFRRQVTDNVLGVTLESNTVLVTILPSTPTFSFATTYCIGSTPGNLPEVSDNGISGSWSPNNIQTATAGTSTYTFTPAAGSCSTTPVQIPIVITNETTATFNLKTAYCLGEIPETLPNVSSNGIKGTWFPSNISTVDTGSTTYTFTPNLGECSKVNVNLKVTVAGASIKSFSYPSSSYCKGSDQNVYYMPKLEGIGSWENGTFSAVPTTGLHLAADTGAIVPYYSIPGTYTITYSVSIPNCGTATKTTTVTILSGANSVKINFPTTIPSPLCLSQSNASGNFPNGNNSYTISRTPAINGTWTINGSTTLTPFTLNSNNLVVDLNWNQGKIPPAGVYVIKFTPEASTGYCESEYTWVVNPLPSASFIYTQPICANMTAVEPVFTNTVGNWQNGTFTFQSGLNGNSTTGIINPSLSTTGSKTVTYNIPAGGGCKAQTASTSVNVIALPSQPAASIGPLSVCEGTTAIYTVVSQTGMTYNWTYPQDWTMGSGGTGNSKTFTVGSTSGAVSVTATANGCTSVPLIWNVSVMAPPAKPVISGTPSVCSGNSEMTYSITNPAEGVNYTWSVTGNGWAMLNGNRGNFKNFNVGTANGAISVTPNNGVCNGTNGTFNVTVNPSTIPQPSQIAYTENIPCKGTTGLKFSVINEGYSYQWIVPYGWVITDGEFTNEITVTVSEFAQEGVITVIARSICAQSQRQLAVLPNEPPQVSSILGPSSACVETTDLSDWVNITNSSPLGYTFEWTKISGPAEITGGQNSNKVTFNVGSISAFSVLQVEVTNQCGSTRHNTTIFALPYTSSDDVIAHDTTVVVNTKVDLHELAVDKFGDHEAELKFYATPNGNTEVDALIDTSVPGTYKYYVAVCHHDYCEGSDRAEIIVIVKNSCTKPIIIQRTNCD